MSFNGTHLWDQESYVSPYPAYVSISTLQAGDVVCSNLAFDLGHSAGPAQFTAVARVALGGETEITVWGSPDFYSWAYVSAFRPDAGYATLISGRINYGIQTFPPDEEIAELGSVAGYRARFYGMGGTKSSGVYNSGYMNIDAAPATVIGQQVQQDYLPGGPPGPAAITFFAGGWEIGDPSPVVNVDVFVDEFYSDPAQWSAIDAYVQEIAIDTVPSAAVGRAGWGHIVSP